MFWMSQKKVKNTSEKLAMTGVGYYSQLILNLMV